MHADKPSATAFRVAMRRAAHQFVDTPLILDDPLAVRIIGPEALQKLKAARRRENSRMARGLRVFMVVRSRVAEDALAEAVALGVRQYVVLGAGLDTSAYRHPHQRAGLRVFEVDHPATQAWKKRRLRSGGILPPPELTFVPMDFETQNLSAQLATAGLKASEPVFFSWLGVTPYLTRDALIGTLRYIASLPKGTTVVFDYGITPSSLGLMEHVIHWLMARKVAQIGEPWRTFFLPDELSALLHQLGFSETTDLDAACLNERYCRGRTDGLKLGGIGHLMKAAV